MIDEFVNLWDQLGLQGNPEAEYRCLYDSYSQAHRYYHNLKHLQACLEDFREVSALTDTPELVELAIWYHDVVYDVNRSDNEQKSADIALDVCKKARLSNKAAQEIHDLILITKHTTSPSTVNQKIITDVDLAILGKPQTEYNLYKKVIRKEYACFSDNDYRKGRIAILRMFLEKPSIFSLDYFQEKYQHQAMINIQKEITELE